MHEHDTRARADGGDVGGDGCGHRWELQAELFELGTEVLLRHGYCSRGRFM